MRRLPMLSLAATVALVGVLSVSHAHSMDRLKREPASTKVDPRSALTEAQKVAVEDVVRDLLTNKDPDLVMRAARAAQEKAEKEDQSLSEKQVKEKKDKLFDDPRDPIAGNPQGDITIVEFFDYKCGYCKRAQPIVAQLLKDDPNVRVVFKEYPILGLGSETASRAALASISQGKYLEFHNALMQSSSMLTEADVIKIAKDVGLDTEKLKAAMKSTDVSQLLSDNRELGVAVGARGTPTFIVGEMVVPGAASLEQIKELIAKARSVKKDDPTRPESDQGAPKDADDVLG